MEIEADDWTVEEGFVVFLKRPRGAQMFEQQKVWAARAELVHQIQLLRGED
ncbi:MAG: hypothetical protein HYS09_02070 [Chloroflexi bacterium]|nr:hypothetical protein [Chloroflexota bacterium]